MYVCFEELNNAYAVSGRLDQVASQLGSFANPAVIASLHLLTKR